MRLTKTYLDSRPHDELRALTFGAMWTAEDLALLAEQWSLASRGLQARFFVDNLLRNWVLCAQEPQLADFEAMFRAFYCDPDDGELASVDFVSYRQARYAGESPLRIPPEAHDAAHRRRFHGRELGECPPVGVLAYNGYHVGKGGVTLAVRRSVLTHIFTSALAPKPSLEEVARYGAPYSEQRLVRMAQVISFFRDADWGQRAGEMAAAVADWDRDLEYLRQNFHAGWFAFEWPVVLPVG